MLKNNRSLILKILIPVLSAVLLLLLAVLLIQPDILPRPTEPALNTIPATREPAVLGTEPSAIPVLPANRKIATATISSTGDILMHQRVIDSGLDASGNGYNYDNIFTYFSKYVQAADLAVANMEGTLCGNEDGRKYTGYPRFNVPDTIVDATKTAGFDVLLTANNHSYDTKSPGFRRTPAVIAEKGLLPLGSVTNADTPNYAVRDIIGIKVGMVCYTYESVKQKNADKSLNAIPMDNADAPLINSFNYERLEDFYQRLEAQIGEMEQDGAEAIVMFIHWGSEYKTTPNGWQKKIGQALCDLGVDVIIGGHAHVLQPVTVFKSRVDPDHSTLCLYSLGNAVSNIRTSATRPAHCEDGVLFSFTLAKYPDGSVIVEGADYLPTWVNRHTDPTTGKDIFAIVPLDTQISDWKTAFGLTDKTLKEAEDSLKRSVEILAEGLEEANQFFAQKQLALEESLA